MIVRRINEAGHAMFSVPAVVRLVSRYINIIDYRTVLDGTQELETAPQKGVVRFQENRGPFAQIKLS